MGRIKVPLTELEGFGRRLGEGFLELRFWQGDMRWALDIQYRCWAHLWIGGSGVQGRHPDWRYKPHLTSQIRPWISAHLSEGHYLPGLGSLTSWRPSFPAWFPRIARLCWLDAVCVLITLFSLIVEWSPRLKSPAPPQLLWWFLATLASRWMIYTTSWPRSFAPFSSVVFFFLSICVSHPLSWPHLRFLHYNNLKKIP